MNIFKHVAAHLLMRVSPRRTREHYGLNRPEWQESPGAMDKDELLRVYNTSLRLTWQPLQLAVAGGSTSIILIIMSCVFVLPQGFDVMTAALMLVHTTLFGYVLVASANYLATVGSLAGAMLRRTEAEINRRWP